MPPKSKSSGGIFGKLVAIRSKRVSTPAPPLKESDRSVLALVSRSVPLSTIAATSACTDNANNNFGQAVSTTVARINSEGRRDSFAHKARDYAISGLTVIQPIADAVPVVGSPIKAAVGTLLEVLKAIDRMSQNNDDIEALKEKLYRLDGRISAMPAARSSSIAKLRDELTRYLTETSKRLKAACSYSTLRYSTIAQDVNRCSTDIDHFLIEYSTLSNMWLENYVEGFRNEMSSMRGFMSMTMKAIRLVDATGRDHAIPMSLAGSYEQFDQAIQILFLRGTADDTVKDRVLRGYTKRGEYDLCIDDDRQIVPISSQESGWSRVQPGTTVVMRITLEQLSPNNRYQCPRCKAWTALQENYRGSSIDCDACQNSRFQVTNITEDSDQGIQFRRTEDHQVGELQLIKNVHILRDELWDKAWKAVEDLAEVFRCRTIPSPHMASRSRFEYVDEEDRDEADTDSYHDDESTDSDSG